MTAQRVPCVIDVSMGTTNPVVRALVQPVRPERFTPEHVSDPSILADQLTRINKLAQDATHQQRSNPIGAPTVYRGLVAGTAGAITSIRHGLGRRAFWWIVGWSGSGVVLAPNLVCDELDTSPITDANTLALRSYVAGTFDLAVA